MHGINTSYQIDNLDNWKLDLLASYTGSDRKDGLISPDGDRYLIKYAEKHTRKNDMDTSYVNNILSEYLSSHILSITGFDVHDTFIATRNNEILVACKNFTSNTEHLIEFGAYMHKHYDSGDINRVPDITQIKYVLYNDPTLKNYADKLWESYCERFVGDALVGNFDRHMGNFGYLVTADGTVRPSPIYDNGSTLLPALSETGMTKVLSDNKELAKRVLLFPKAALTVNNQKITYYDMLSSNYDKTMSKAVRKVVPEIINKLPQINKFLDAQSFLSDTRKDFYKRLLDARVKMILQPVYECCRIQQYNKSAYERLDKGINYDEKLFERQYDIMINNRYEISNSHNENTKNTYNPYDE